MVDHSNSFVNGRGIDWAKSIQENIFRIADKINNSADEVWIRNFRKVGNDPELDIKLFSSVKNVLKPNGAFILVNTYDELPDGGLSRIRQELEDLGFDVEELDLNKDTHPLIAGFRRLEKDMPEIKFPGVKPTPYAIRARKK